jgi:Zn-finger protein
MKEKNNKETLPKPDICRWCKTPDTLVFKANYEHWEDNEYDDVWLCTHCRTIYGKDFFEYKIEDIEAAQLQHDLKAAQSFSDAVQF